MDKKDISVKIALGIGFILFIDKLNSIFKGIYKYEKHDKDIIEEYDEECGEHCESEPEIKEPDCEEDECEKEPKHNFWNKKYYWWHHESKKKKEKHEEDEECDEPTPEPTCTPTPEPTCTPTPKPPKPTHKPKPIPTPEPTCTPTPEPTCTPTPIPDEPKCIEDIKECNPVTGVTGCQSIIKSCLPMKHIECWSECLNDTCGYSRFHRENCYGCIKKCAVSRERR